MTPSLIPPGYTADRDYLDVTVTAFAKYFYNILDSSSTATTLLADKGGCPSVLVALSSRCYLLKDISSGGYEIVS